jgi:hypothetical protein
LYGYWAVTRFLGLGVLAVPFVWLGGERLRDQFLSTGGFVEHLPIYLVAFVVVLMSLVTPVAAKTCDNAPFETFA